MEKNEKNIESEKNVLTRAKAKASNTEVNPFKLTQPLSTVPEAVTLIEADLYSDDEDEEYQPGEEDFHVIHYFSLFFPFNNNFYFYLTSLMMIQTQLFLILTHNQEPL